MFLTNGQNGIRDSIGIIKETDNNGISINTPFQISDYDGESRKMNGNIGLYFGFVGQIMVFVEKIVQDWSGYDL